MADVNKKKYCPTPVIRNVTEMESRPKVSKGWEEEGVGSDCPMGTEFLFGVMKKNVVNRQWGRLHNTVNELNATELRT